MASQIYDSPESDLKLNEVFEFVGVLASDPELQEDKEANDFSNGFCEDPLHHFPSNKKVSIVICMGGIFRSSYIT